MQKVKEADKLNEL